MKKLLLVAALFVVPAFAQDGQAPEGAPVVAPVVAPADSGVVTREIGDKQVLAEKTVVVTAVPTTEAEKMLSDPLGSWRNFYVAAKEGKWSLAAMFMLFAFVGALRVFGRRAHAAIPDDTKDPFLRPLESFLGFVFDTKVGGWLLNWLTAIAGCLAMAHLAGMEVDGHAWRTAFIASTGSTALIELKDDITEWWKARQARIAEELKKSTDPKDPPPPTPIKPA